MDKIDRSVLMNRKVDNEALSKLNLGDSSNCN